MKTEKFYPGPLFYLTFSVQVFQKTKGLHKTHHALRAYAALVHELPWRLYPALREVLVKLYLVCLKPFACPRTCCPSAWNSLSPLAHLQISAHPSSFNSSVICSVHFHPSEGRCSLTVFLSMVYSFPYYFPHLIILQFIHISLSTRVPSLLRKRTISLICYF